METRRPGTSTRITIAVLVAAVVMVAAVLSYSRSPEVSTTTLIDASATSTSTTTVTSLLTTSGPYTTSTSFSTASPPTAVMTITVNSTQTSTITVSSSNLAQLCNIQVSNESSSRPADANAPVLLMNPNSTGLVCVTYQTAWAGNQTLFESMQSSLAPFLTSNGTYTFFPFIVASYHCNSNGLQCNQTISHSFSVTAYPESVNVSGSMNYVTVIYTVTALGNSTGLYGTSAPWTGCVGMPMAVGYSASQVNGTDFPQPNVLCPIEPFIPISESVLGMEVTYVDLLSSTSSMTMMDG